MRFIATSKKITQEAEYEGCDRVPMVQYQKASRIH